MPVLGFLIVLQFGFDFGGLIPSIIDGITGLLNDVIAGLLNLILNVVDAVIYVYDILSGIFNFFYRGLKFLIDHLRAVAEWIHTRLIGRIIEWVQNIKAKLHQIFDPILKVLRQIKAIQDQWYNQVLKPIFDFIQRLRRVLLVFRLLHIKWATKLDKYLADQEAKVARAFLDVRAKMNELITWVNFVIDPFGNIYSNVFLNTALTSINALWALLWGAQKGSLTAQEQAGQAHDAKIGTRNNTLSEVRLRSQTGLTPDDTALREEALANFAALGFTR